MQKDFLRTVAKCFLQHKLSLEIVEVLLIYIFNTFNDIISIQLERIFDEIFIDNLKNEKNVFIEISSNSQLKAIS